MDVFEDRILSDTIQDFDTDDEITLRPKYLSQYIGQDRVKEQLDVYIKAAKERNEQLDHVLLYGPPGLGKTTLSGIIANELNVNLKITSGPAIEKSGDLAAILTNLQENDVLFIDEIHRLSHSVEEVLYPAMEDFVLDIIIGKGPSARNIRLDISKFTLVGATTKAGNITSPLRDRFGIIQKLDLYDIESLKKIVERDAKILGIEINKDASTEIAKRGRGTPRIVIRLLKRVRDYSIVKGQGIITLDITKMALDKMMVDEYGLDEVDRKLLKTILKLFNGGPVGIETLAASIGEDRSTIEDVYEPYLLQIGFLQRTPRGRIITEAAKKHLNISLT